MDVIWPDARLDAKEDVTAGGIMLCWELGDTECAMNCFC
jgi:hypothetical protein